MLVVSIIAFFILTFLLIAIVVGVAWMGILKTAREEAEAARRDQETSGEAGPAVAAYVEPTIFREEKLSTIAILDRVLTRFDFMELLRERIAQADLNWSVGRVMSGMLLLGTVSFVILQTFLPWLGALIGGAALGFLPYGYILRRRNKRFDKFREYFPDVLDSLSRALRAGYPLSAGMEMISSETLPPVADEIRRTSAEANLGVGWNKALEDLGKRVPLLEVNLFIAAVQLHARTGGKLSEVMSGLAETMRESFALQGEVRSMAAHGKLTGVILTLLPIGIAIMMMIVSPGYMTVLFNHPWGKHLITAAVVCLVLAQLVIRKIVDIKV
jgi:tight adherence protein B